MRKPNYDSLIKFILTFTLILNFAPFANADEKAPSSKKPNIVYILADDLGWKDVGFHGSEIKTPQIDSLAASGAQLTQFYVQPMCTPTRAALMTGRYPLRYGLQTAVIASGHKYGLPTDEWILPQALKEAGYSTAIIGKWHLGHADKKYWPKQRGFDYQYGPLIGEIDYFTHRQHGVLDWYRNNKPLNQEGYSTTLIGNEAVNYINKVDASAPFFLYLTFNAPHTPYQATPEYLERYSHIADPSRRAYAAMITAMDDQIGRVLTALDKKGVRENTLIIFHSDNGGTRNPMFAGEGDMSKVKIPCDNGIYREGKASLYEGGTRVVSLANWPGQIEAGSSVDGMIHVVDMYPTLTKLAGTETTKNKPLDGMDVWPTISEGAESPRNEIVYNVEPLRGGVRQDQWKLIWRTSLPYATELYNLEKDPSEKNDLAADNPRIVSRLQARIQELASSMSKSLFMAAAFEGFQASLSTPPAIADSED